MAAPDIPRLRGVFHMYAFLGLIPVSLVLIVRATSGRERLAGVCFVVGLGAMFGTSALYHRGNWSTLNKSRWQRLDHSTIFFAISGTYSAVALLALNGWSFGLLLAVVWTGTLVGVLLQWRKTRPSRVISTVVYAIVGWSAVPLLPRLYVELSPAAFWLVAIGGFAYTVGAVVYATRRPDPSPSLFGFHEVFHALTVVGAGCHFIAIAIMM
jgi:hemolysin III